MLAALASLAALVLLHRLCSELRNRRTALLACAAVSFFPFAYVLSTNYSEGLFLLASLGAFAAARSRHPCWRSPPGSPRASRGPRRSRSRSASRPTPCSRPSAGAPSLAGAAGAVAGVARRLRRPRAPPRRLAREPARAAARLAALDEPRRRARRARRLRARCDHARALPEPALPHGRAAGRDRAGGAVAQRHPRRHVRVRRRSRWRRRSRRAARCRSRAS